MKLLKLAAAMTVMVLPFSCLSAPARAASAHNSQAGSFGPSTNPTDSTPASRRVKHSAKHMMKHMTK